MNYSNSAKFEREESAGSSTGSGLSMRGNSVLLLVCDNWSFLLGPLISTFELGLFSSRLVICFSLLGDCSPMMELISEKDDALGVVVFRDKSCIFISFCDNDVLAERVAQRFEYVIVWCRFSIVLSYY